MNNGGTSVKYGRSRQKADRCPFITRLNTRCTIIKYPARIVRQDMKTFLSAFTGTLLLALGLLLGPADLVAQDDPVDTVQVLSQPGARAYECCYTFVVSNRRTGPDSTRISQFRVRIVSGNANFIAGQAGSPFDWSVFLDNKEVQWLSNSAESEIDTGESLTSFRVCVRDTGVYRIVWETMNLDSLLSRDTLVLICSGRDNCDEAFFRPLPSSFRCGFDIDLMNENGGQKVVNDFHLTLVSPGMTFDTVGSRIPAGWRLDRLDGATISWKTSGDGLSFSDFIENFRVFVNSNGSSQIRLRWKTTNFGDSICSDILTLNCGLAVPDSLYTRRATVEADTCCQDFLLVNTHVPRSPLKSFRLAMNSPNSRFITPPGLPPGWSARLNGAGDSITFTIDSLLAPGDSVFFQGLCYEHDLAPDDTVRYTFQTMYEELVVTQGIVFFPCFRDVIFCDSVSARVDSALNATERCITLSVGNRNSRRDDITLLTAHISNPGVAHRILSANAPAGWSVASFTNDSVVFHRGRLRAGENRDDFEFCVNIDTNALDPLTIRWTTWATANRAICTEELLVNANVVRVCDSVEAVENDQSIDPFCCFDITFSNHNDRNVAIDAMQLRIPRVDLIFDTASVLTGSWNVATSIFPNVRVDYNGDILPPNEDVTFRFCVNAVAVEERPLSFRVIWQTYSEGQVVCFDTVLVRCEGADGICDTINLTMETANENGCSASWQIRNTHTPESFINNVQFSILSDNANFASGTTDGTAAGFDEVSLAPKQIVFRGSSIASGETAENFTVEFDATTNTDVIVEICTFEDDMELCCEIDTVSCTFTSVGNEDFSGGTLSHSANPNPFDGRTEIRYRMERPGGVTLVLLDAGGDEVRRYEEGLQSAGSHAISVEAEGLSAGVYYYVLQAGDERGTGRIVLVK